MRTYLLILLCLSFCSQYTAFGAEKVICAFRAASPPVIDGSLSDACWKSAEAHNDFIPLYSLKLEETTMRLVYDADNLYLGLDIRTADPKPLHAKVQEMRTAPGFAEGFVDINHFTNQCGVEIFLDPGATMRNHYQVLFNAAGQITGHYKYDWDNPFPLKPYGRAQLTPRGWSAEIVFPRAALNNAALNPGGEWGFDLVRNDLQPVSIWRETGIAFNTPAQFGRLIIGDYQAWWEQVWKQGKAKVEALRSSSGQAQSPVLVALGRDLARSLSGESQVPARLTTRKQFLVAYRKYESLYPIFHRFDALYSTTQAIREAR